MKDLWIFCISFNILPVLQILDSSSNHFRGGLERSHQLTNISHNILYWCRFLKLHLPHDYAIDEHLPLHPDRLLKRRIATFLFYSGFWPSTVNPLHSNIKSCVDANYFCFIKLLPVTFLGICPHQAAFYITKNKELPFQVLLIDLQ